jgi:hypothetical protein
MNGKFKKGYDKIFQDPQPSETQPSRLPPYTCSVINLNVEFICKFRITCLLPKY